MPVELPDPSPDDERPTPPSRIVWLTLLILFLAVGIAWTLLTWPNGKPTDTLWFWMRLLGYPTLAWGALFGLRLHFYEEECNHLAAREEVRQADREEAIAFGAEPLAVLGSTYLCAMASNGVAERISHEESVLQARVPGPRVPAIRHTRLELVDDGGGTDRYRLAFQGLLKAMEGPMRTLPSRVPFEVRLQLPNGIDPLVILATWNACWDECGLRAAEAALVPATEGLMMLDAWLDEFGGPALERFTLFVAAQLYDTPPADSGEAAAALLLGWAPLAERRDLMPLALLHRPVESEADAFADAMARVALYGRAPPEELDHLWQTGLSKAEKTTLLKSATDVRLGAAQADGLPGVHDIDLALGNPGVAGSWLAAALAIEHAQQTNKPQLIACNESTLRLAVVRPVDRQSESEAN